MKKALAAAIALMLFGCSKPQAQRGYGGTIYGENGDFSISYFLDSVFYGDEDVYVFSNPCYEVNFAKLDRRSVDEFRSSLDNIEWVRAVYDKSDYNYRELEETSIYLGRSELSGYFGLFTRRAGIAIFPGTGLAVVYASLDEINYPGNRPYVAPGEWADANPDGERQQLTYLPWFIEPDPKDWSKTLFFYADPEPAKDLLDKLKQIPGLSDYITTKQPPIAGG